MKLMLISGAMRKNSQSTRIMKAVSEVVAQLVPGSETDLLDLGEKPLDLWDEGVWSGEAKWKTQWDPIAKRIENAEAFVFFAPEYGGMVPASLKNLFLFTGGGMMSHKPALIVSVSGSINGAYPISELRMSSYKNSKVLFLPDHVIVRNAEKVYQGEPVDEHEVHMRERMDYGIKLLKAYSDALKTVRASGVIDNEKFPFGM